MDSWLRIAIFALILLSFLRRIFKAKTQGGIPSPAKQGSLPQTMTRQTMTRPLRGRKNDFRDVPPPPENPELE
ncbi:MAG: hypothetical protein WA172_17020 [Terriglobales bacterium]